MTLPVISLKDAGADEGQRRWLVYVVCFAALRAADLCWSITSTNSRSGPH